MRENGQLVYHFGPGLNEGSAGMSRLLGGKGAHLAEMASLGLPVPPGFTITTDVCSFFAETGGSFPAHLRAHVESAIGQVESELGKTFGDAASPLLLSVRSGAPVSMPGMMDTVLNLGLNDTTVAGLAAASGDERFAWDAYRRFVHMYADVVMGVHSSHFEAAIEQARHEHGAQHDHELDAATLRDLVATYRQITIAQAGTDVPADPHAQLWGAIAAVFTSWSSERAVVYRRHHNISDSLGTAVTVQSMVFGNAGNDCATGVAFSRNPATGDTSLYGEFLINAQGEDVVAGIRTPLPITRDGASAQGIREDITLEAQMPSAFAELFHTCTVLEQHFGDAQDVEFTVQHDKLWMLQTRAAKRTAAAAIQMAVDMVDEGLITRDEAIARVNAGSIDQLLHPSFDTRAEVTVLGYGMPASPGAASGRIALDAATAVRMSTDDAGAVILVRAETSPEDIEGMIAARGILTARGGMTSHAAVVARGMGTTCVSGCSDLQINMTARTITLAGVTVSEGEHISINGTTGAVIAGMVPTVEPTMSGAFERFMGWVAARGGMQVRANADTPHDAQVARAFGATGIGLCRTEHMFFESGRILHFRRMILAQSEASRLDALAELMPMQREDFVGIFTAMDGLPVTVRLLDPPLHEFLPHPGEDLAELERITGMSEREIAAAADQLRESNPMLGHRGCRLGITTPEIYRMQAQSIAEAVVTCIEQGVDARPEIMIPLVGTSTELELIASDVRSTVDAILGDYIAQGMARHVPVGTMIEIPRACITADEIARTAEFFSFGTNDLTQLTYGFSRDDAGTFLGEYTKRQILPCDPFQTIDRAGVGSLMQMAVERGRTARESIKLGLCGEHGGDPESVALCHDLGLDYVSCSPYRVPIARLAAAQANLRAPRAHVRAPRFVSGAVEPASV